MFKNLKLSKKVLVTWFLVINFSFKKMKQINKLKQ